MQRIDRARLRQRIASPTVSPELAAELATLPAALLAELALDDSEPWWRRRACAQALVGRVPKEHTPALFACVRDTGVTTEVRVVVLAALSEPVGPEREVLLAWLRAQDGVEQQYGFDLAVLRARAALGDLEVAPRLAALAADAWHHRRTLGEALLDAAIATHGLAAVLAALGADSLATLALHGADPARRLLGVRLLDRAGADVKPALADASVIVAQAAQDLLAGTTGDDEALWDRVRQRGPGHLWALVVLHRRGHAIHAAWQALGAPVVLPGVPSDVREAILRAYAPGERETDPRWLLEAACLDPDVAVDEHDLLRRAGEALAHAGLEPQAPISAGEQYQQGGGTYHIFATAAGSVTVSTLGPFFTSTREPRVIAALEAAGFRNVDGELAGTRFAGLHVYFFGARDPLRVVDLLFYWQD